jgi:hypothetical protein
LINVIAVFSDNSARGFPSIRTTVTDQAWDPSVDAPFSEGTPQTTFIGDYFGFAASELGFFPFWTDTRTGIQEIFTAGLSVTRCRGTLARRTYQERGSGRRGLTAKVQQHRHR